jgi:hypothetical protein
MRCARQAAIEQARRCSVWGLVLGTLGRQGNPALLCKIQKLLQEKGLKHSLVLLSEVMPAKLAMMQDVEAWVQVACPRYAMQWYYALQLRWSDDWGSALNILLGSRALPSWRKLKRYALWRLSFCVMQTATSSHVAIQDIADRCGVLGTPACMPRAAAADLT